MNCKNYKHLKTKTFMVVKVSFISWKDGVGKMVVIIITSRWMLWLPCCLAALLLVVATIDCCCYNINAVTSSIVVVIINAVVIIIEYYCCYYHRLALFLLSRYLDRIAAWASAICSELTFVEVIQGCFSASDALKRLTGSITRSFWTKSRASLLT